MGKRSRGRPTKCTQDVIDAIADDIKSFSPPEHAAENHGVSRTRHFEWLRLGALDESHEDFREHFRDYRDAVTRATSAAIVKAARHSVGFDRDGNPNPKDYQWILERRASESFGAKTKVQVETVVKNVGSVIFPIIREECDTETFARICRRLVGQYGSGILDGVES